MPPSLSLSTSSLEPPSPISSAFTPLSPLDAGKQSPSSFSISSASTDFQDARLAAAIRSGLEDARKGVLMTKLSDSMISKTAGYMDGAQFREATSSKNAIEQAQIPYLAINARDDALFPGRYLPVDKFRKSTHSVLLSTEKGGHLGFFEKKVGAGRQSGRYTARVMKDWVMGIEKVSLLGLGQSTTD